MTSRVWRNSHQCSQGVKKMSAVRLLGACVLAAALSLGGGVACATDEVQSDDQERSPVVVPIVTFTQGVDESTRLYLNEPFNYEVTIDMDGAPEQDLYIQGTYADAANLELQGAISCLAEKSSPGACDKITLQQTGQVNGIDYFFKLKGRLQSAERVVLSGTAKLVGSLPDDGPFGYGATLSGAASEDSSQLIFVRTVEGGQVFTSRTAAPIAPRLKILPERVDEGATSLLYIEGFAPGEEVLVMLSARGAPDTRITIRPDGSYAMEFQVVKEDEPISFHLLGQMSGRKASIPIVFSEKKKDAGQSSGTAKPPASQSDGKAKTPASDAQSGKKPAGKDAGTQATAPRGGKQAPSKIAHTGTDASIAVMIALSLAAFGTVGVLRRR